MYRVEYLIIDPQTNTKSIKALKNLLQSDDDIGLSNNYLKYGGEAFEYRIKTGHISTGNQPIYFNLEFICDKEEIIPVFIKALKSIRRVLSLLNKSQFVLWDDLSLYYSKQAYEKMFYIENLMRKLLTKFMFINLGMSWTEDRIPDEVKKSVNTQNKDVNFLHNVDFIQLSKFLFSENYPTHKDSLIKKLNQAKNLDEINIEEIRSLLPESNWKKYFEELVDCDADYLSKRWAKLYNLRNSIAHNRTFKINDLDDVENLVDEIGEYLEAAIDKLEEVIVPEDEIDDVVENVASGRNEKIGEFIGNFRNFEKVLLDVARQFGQQNDSIKRGLLSLQETLKLVSENIIIPEESIKKLQEIIKIRDVLVHGSNLEIAIENLDNPIRELSSITDNLNNHIQVNESYHTDKIKDSKIVEGFDVIKEFLLGLEGVNVKYNRHYVSFLLNRNFVDIKLQQKSIKVWLNMPKGTLNDQFDLAKDVSEIGHQGNGDYEISILPNQDIEKIKGLIIQSYEYNKEK